MEDNPGARLRHLRNELGLDQKGLALRLGMSPGVIGFAERGDRPPSKRLLERLYSTFNISQDWLMYGTGEMLVRTSTVTGRTGQLSPPDTTMPAHGDFKLDGVEFQRIRRWDIEASAGNGLTFVSDQVVDHMAFTRDWLLRHGINGDLAGLVRVKGDSMLPTIQDGALALIHRAELNVESGNVYAFSFDDEVFIKRLANIEESGERGLLISSDNPSYRPQKVLGRETERIRIAGRVRTVITDF